MQANEGHKIKEIRARQIIATLLSLAGRLERACQRSALLRLFLLWLVGPVELATRGYVVHEAEEAGMAGLPHEMGLSHDMASWADWQTDSAVRALAMAVRLRALACALTIMFGSQKAAWRAADADYWKSFARHMLWLTKSADELAHLRQAAAGRFQRPEVRSGALPVIIAASRQIQTAACN